MKKAALTLAITAIVSTTAAANECHIKKYTLFRSATGKNTAMVSWKCKDRYGTDTIDRKNLCGETSDGKVVCANGGTYIWADPRKKTEVKFKRTKYPIERLFLRN